MFKLMQVTIGLSAIAVLGTIIACSNSPSENYNIILTVNDFEMTQKEFQAHCGEDMEYRHDMKGTLGIKKDMLNRIIRKELLIQEAKKRGLDKNEKFISAIEKYWEATLIKLLMEKKNAEIQKITLVSEEEIKKKYDEYRLKNSVLPPLEEIETELAAEILETKKTESLDNWIDTLHEKARITINRSLLTDENGEKQ